MIILSNPFIVIDEISQKLNEINSSISNTLSTINSNVNTINTNVSTVSTNVNTANTNINAIKTATAASTSASSSGTLSQKLTYIISTLIGATGATGGTETSGTVMAKLNRLLKCELSKLTYYTFYNQYSATANTAKTIVTLNNIMLYGLSVATFFKSTSHVVNVIITIDDTTLTIDPSSSEYGSTAYRKLYNSTANTAGLVFSSALSAEPELFTLSEPVYVSKLVLSVTTSSTSSTYANADGTIAYKQF